MSIHSAPEEWPEEARRRWNRRQEAIPVAVDRRSDERRNVPGVRKLFADLMSREPLPDAPRVR